MLFLFHFKFLDGCLPCSTVQYAVVQSIRFDSLKKKIKELQKILSSVLFDTFYFFFTVFFCLFLFSNAFLSLSTSFHSISFLLFPSSYTPSVILISLHAILSSFPSSQSFSFILFFMVSAVT